MDLIAIIGAIIFGVISFLTGREEQSKPVAKPSTTPSGPEPTVSSHPSSEKEIREEQTPRAEDIREQNQHPDSSEGRPVFMDDDITKGNPVNGPQTRPRSPGKGKKSLPIKSPISMKEQLSQKRLAESIIMSEVLGSPRAHKPYRPNQYRK
ncbi:hypothetical protein GWK91_07500 [Virgibacillus sp. MSP4-1]|uniref:hypothetical protein n=1 Tax=Virgibacillus sp. MSP4-1 TaxID=2700081 RepID=UPI00039DA7C6|nr:hypothetical protein [Virgibacillus sp. MSP4-1]QHS22797.1 hypothetical protein GWK91_07500 [Virgibacillus sp. MSP4-1]